MATKIDHAALAQVWRDARTLEEAAARLGLDAVACRRAARRDGLPPLPRLSRVASDARAGLVRAMLARGCTTAQIAREAHVGHRRVQQIAQELGIPHDGRRTEVDEAAFRADWADVRLSTREVGARHGISHHTARRLAVRLGLPRRARRRLVKLNAPAAAVLEQAWNDGETKRAIADRLGVSAEAVTRWAAVLALPERTPGRAPVAGFRDKVAAMSADGISAAEIADRLGVKRQAIYDARHRMGLPRLRSAPAAVTRPDHPGTPGTGGTEDVAA